MSPTSPEKVFGDEIHTRMGLRKENSRYGIKGRVLGYKIHATSREISLSDVARRPGSDRNALGRWGFAVAASVLLHNLLTLDTFVIAKVTDIKIVYVYSFLYPAVQFNIS